jgi:hypothetical protein
MTTPAYRFLSLGAGVQSTTVMLLAATGKIAPFDAAIFADTGWEPPEVTAHLDRLEGVAAQAGIPIRRVSAGNIRDDALDPSHRFASMPLFTLGPNGERGMARRQCTSEYKIRPIKKEVRLWLGYPGNARIPTEHYAEMSIGISLDEIGRARDSDVRYMRNAFPLLDLKWRREDCLRYLADNGWASTPRSACTGCPYRSDDEWARIKQDPRSWEDAVAFDAAIRYGSARANAGGHPMRGQFYLHAQRIPLNEVKLRPRTDKTEAQRPGCGPWTCPHSEPAPPESAPAVAGQGVA